MNAKELAKLLQANAQAAGVMARNYYFCPDDKTNWSSVADSACPEPCPSCDKATEPHATKALSEVRDALFKGLDE